MAANTITIASNAAGGLLATLVLGTDQRGVVVLGLTISGIAALVGTLGTNTAYRSQLPRCADISRATLVVAYTWCLAGSIVIAAAVAIATTWASAPLITAELAAPGMLAAVGAAAASQVILLQTTDAWYADGHFRRGSTGAAAMSLTAFLCSVTTLMLTRSPTLFLLAHAAGTTAAGAVQLVALRRTGLLTMAVPKRSTTTAWIRRGIPTLGLSVGLMVALRADRYLLGTFAGAAAVGVYSLAATLSEFGRLLPTLISQLFLRDAALGNAATRWSRTVRLASLTAVGGALLIAPTGWLLIIPIFGTEFADARHLLLVLTIAELCLLPHVVAGHGLLGGGWHRAAGLTGLIGIPIALGTYATATAVAGTAGAAIGSMLVYATLSLLTWRLFHNRLTPKNHSRRSHPAPIENNASR